MHGARHEPGRNASCAYEVNRVHSSDSRPNAAKILVLGILKRPLMD
jgi:hypothetical protein